MKPAQTVWSESVHRSLDESLVTLAATVTACPDALWRRPMWPVDDTDFAFPLTDASGEVVSDPTHRAELAQRWSTPWSVAWHTLEVLDYDLSGELEPWAPPDPFDGHPHWQSFAGLADPWSRQDITGYVHHCRERLSQVFGDLTDERAGAVLPSTHRHGGQPYAFLVTSLIGHTTAHAIQIRQLADHP